MLTQDQLRAVVEYDPETGSMTWRVSTAQRIKAGDQAGGYTPYGYRRAQIDGRAYLVHRLAWLYVYGRWPLNHIDHMNGVRDDNRIANLRDVPRIVNAQGYLSRPAGETGLRGVYKTKNKDKQYMARINSKGRSIHLGVFDNPTDAHAAYLKAKAAVHAPITKEQT